MQKTKHPKINYATVLNKLRETFTKTLRSKTLGNADKTDIKRCSRLLRTGNIACG